MQSTNQNNRYNYGNSGEKPSYFWYGNTPYSLRTQKSCARPTVSMRQMSRGDSFGCVIFNICGTMAQKRSLGRTLLPCLHDDSSIFYGEWVHTIFTKGNNKFSDFLFASLVDEAPNRGLLLKGRICSNRSKFFP